MSDEELALLKTVLAFPDEDGPRLVYADWWEQHGQCERSEFVRLQCRIAAIEKDCLCGRCVQLRGGGQHTNGPCNVDREREELPDGTSRKAFLRQRGTQLLDVAIAHWETWGWPHMTFHDRVTFRRGFVDSVELPAAAWLTHADAILACQPVREVRLTMWPGLEVDMEKNDGRGAYYLTGRNQSYRPEDPENHDATDTIGRLLNAEWPRLRFTLPDGSVVEPEKTT